MLKEGSALRVDPPTFPYGLPLRWLCRESLPKGVITLSEKLFGRRKSTSATTSNLLLFFPSSPPPSHLTPPPEPQTLPARDAPPLLYTSCAPAANLVAKTSAHSCRTGSPVTRFAAEMNSADDIVPDSLSCRDSRPSATKPLPRTPPLGVPRNPPLLAALLGVAEVPDLDDGWPAAPRLLALLPPLAPPAPRTPAAVAAERELLATPTCV